jgi:hypothetical protein
MSERKDKINVDDEEINSLKKFIAEKFTITDNINEFIDEKV